MGVIVRDYFLVEESVMDLRFEAQRIGVNHRRQPPPTWLLRHWQDLIQLGRDQPHNKMTPEEVSHWMALVLYYPSSANYEKLLKALSMNGRHEEAQYWGQTDLRVHRPANLQPHPVPAGRHRFPLAQVAWEYPKGYAEP
jgi:hypothetical protein